MGPQCKCSSYVNAYYILCRYPLIMKISFSRMQKRILLMQKCPFSKLSQEMEMLLLNDLSFCPLLERSIRFDQLKVQWKRSWHTFGLDTLELGGKEGQLISSWCGHFQKWKVEFHKVRGRKSYFLSSECHVNWVTF